MEVEDEVVVAEKMGLGTNEVCGKEYYGFMEK